MFEARYAKTYVRYLIKENINLLSLGASLGQQFGEI